MTDPLLVLAALAALVGVSEALVRHTALRHLGTALLVILLAAAAVNLGLLPPVGAAGAGAVYDVLLGPVAQLAIFWLLLGVHLGELRRAGGAMLGVFLLGAFGTLAGVLTADRLVGGAGLGERGPALAAMFVGTYTGGSINFNAMAEAYGVLRDGPTYAIAVVVDNTMTTLWMAITLIVPRLFGARWVGPAPEVEAPTGDEDAERLDPAGAAWTLAVGLSVVWGSREAARWIPVPAILILTTVALVLAHTPLRRRLTGTRMLGMLAVYLFLAAIGALCDLAALRAAGPLGLRLFGYVALALAVHGAVVFGATAALRLRPEVAAVASQANVGGGTSALALARSLGRADLVLPAILVGSLGNALGNYLGVLAAQLARGA